MAKAGANPVERQSVDLVKENIARLKELFPEAVSEGKVDFAKLKATLGEIVDDRPERYSFTWAGKRDAIRLLQVPSRATLKPCPEESVNWDTTKNLFIEGENLEVLKLLYKSYAGRVKMIYIDPPYNTGNDFIYPDDFTDPLENYLAMTGQKDGEGNLLTSNPETSGRYHSAWLSMMYPRLFVARQLLREDGVVFVSIDDRETHNLRVLMNEVFGEENFVGTVCWQKKYAPANDRADLSDSHDFVLVYLKQRPTMEVSGTQTALRRLPRTEDMNKPYKNPDNDPRGFWKAGDYTCNKSAEERPNLYYPIIHPRTGEEIWPKKSAVWRYSREESSRHVTENRVWWGLHQENLVPAYKRFLSEVPGLLPTTWWPFGEVGHTDEARKELNEFFPEVARSFETPKPVRLLKRMISLATGKDECDEPDIILDFFAGTCTTAQAVVESNLLDGHPRIFIMVQMPESITAQTLENGVSLDTVADIGRERMRRMISKLNTKIRSTLDFESSGSSSDLGFRVFELTGSAYRQWRGSEQRDGQKYTDEMELFTDPLLPGWKPEDVIWEVALKEGYSLSSMVEALPGVKENQVFCVTDPDREQSFCICLDDKLHDKTAEALAFGKEDLFVCRDAALTDEQAANLALQCKLKTI